MVALVAVLGLAAPAGATSTVELQQDPKAWNGQSVVVTGELVGDYGVQSDGVWVQLNDDQYAQLPLLEEGLLLGTNSGIGALVPPRLFDPDAWGPPGHYRNRGPIVTVTAVFHFHSPLRQGATFLEVTSVELVESSRPLVDNGPTWPRQAGLSLLGIALLFVTVVRRVRLRSRRS